MKTNKEYKDSALAALKGNWEIAVVTTLIYIAIATLISGASNIPSLFGTADKAMGWLGGTGSIFSILIVLPLGYGYMNSVRFLYESQNRDMINNMFQLPIKNYAHVLFTMFLMAVKIFLWSLLLIIPGIVKTFGYAMTPYILADNPEMSALDAIHESDRMMKGHKFDLFYLYLSFIGWFFLSILTCGIGFLWLEPWTSAAVASFYEDLKGIDGVQDAKIVD